MPDIDEQDIQSMEWLSLGKAAVLLGVHSMTLRRWSDSGRFPCTRTAGGHRRYAASDVQAYLAQQKRGQDDDMSMNWASAALTETRQQVGHHREHRWLKKIEEEDLKNEYRQLGHQLMGLLLQYVATDDPNGSFTTEARRIGTRYGIYGKQAGLTLTSILEATLFFRDILLESSLQVPVNGYRKSDASLRILQRVNRIINAVQLAVSEYYEDPPAQHTVDAA
ncbi:MAG: helix-turn-helix domain-containing protein [Candidatus Promineifilaceae bacterium]|jgi:excisionase family DNA binding protein